MGKESRLENEWGFCSKQVLEQSPKAAECWEEVSTAPTTDGVTMGTKDPQAFIVAGIPDK